MCKSSGSSLRRKFLPKLPERRLVPTPDAEVHAWGMDVWDIWSPKSYLSPLLALAMVRQLFPIVMAAVGERGAIKPSICHREDILIKAALHPFQDRLV